MIETETVFILGAGASKPYNYPTGSELREYICGSFPRHFPSIFRSRATASGSIPIRGAIEENYITDAKKFSRAFQNSSTPSIDLYLNRNQNFSKIGKLAIVLSIFNYESLSKFREEVEDRDEDWYSYIFHRMTSSLIEPDSYKDFGNNKVTFVTFNYDRSLEHFLFESLKNSFMSASEEEIIEEIHKIPIHHVYGKIADLPWEKYAKNKIGYLCGMKGKTPYEKFSYHYLTELSSNIRLIHERKEHNCAEIIKSISRAKKIFFLGFGYAEENLEILDIPSYFDGTQKIFGTAKNFSEKYIDETRATLNINFRNKDPVIKNPEIEDKTCLPLLKEHL